MLNTLKSYLMSICLLMVMVFSTLGISGCAGNSERAERIKALAPPPEVVGLIANQAMRIVLEKKDLSPEKMKAIQIIMVDAKGVLVSTLKEDPSNLESVRLEYLGSKDPDVAELANTVTQLAVFWAQSMIDRGKTDKAGTYIESVLDGAVMALNAKIGAG